MVDVEILKEAEWEGYHFGHMFLSLLSRKPDEINQIDAATGVKETNASVLRRSVQLAKCLRKLDLRPGDVMAVAGRNHVNLHIPHYAAMLNGLPLVGVDHTFKYDEIYGLFKLTKPKIAFCHYENSKEYERVARALDLDIKIVTYDEGECTMAKFVDSFNEDGSLDGFKPAIFDLDKVYFWLISTGGSTGAAKIAAFKHRPWVNKAIKYLQMMASFQKENAKNWVDNKALNVSPVHWISGFFSSVGPALGNQCKLQTSGDHTTEHIIDIINEYKPASCTLGPSLVAAILNHEKDCDLTCFNRVILTGGQMYKDMLIKLKTRMRKDALVFVAYGMTEMMGPTLSPEPLGPLGNCGKPISYIKIKLVDPETRKEITEPNTPGEVWTKGDGFAEYFNNPEETAQAFSEDGWFKTGDILYRDENGYYFYVERLKMLIKYRNHQVIPAELEEVIRTHPDVLDVCVTSIPDEQDGEHPVACVVRRPGSDVTAEEIKGLVAEKLSASKHLRGGVVFMKELPLTSTRKVARMRLRKLVQNAVRE